jgi:hypothetical protein
MPAEDVSHLKYFMSIAHWLYSLCLIVSHDVDRPSVWTGAVRPLCHDALKVVRSPSQSPRDGGWEHIQRAICHPDGADLNVIAVLEDDGVRHAMCVHVCSVFAVEILECRFSAVEEDAGVATREGWRIDSDSAIAIPADQVQTLGE